MTLANEALLGRPLSCRVIDCHAHMGPWFNFNIPNNSPKDMVEMMDRLGIDCCVSSAHPSIGPDFKLGNDIMLDAMRDFPGRIYGYCGVNPRYPEQEMRDEMKRCIDAGMKGIKFHPEMHQYPVDGPAYRPAWEFAEEHALPVLTHTSIGSPLDDPGQLLGLAKEFQNTKVILGHSGFGIEGARKSIAVAKDCQNVYLDLTGSVCVYGVLEWMVSELGAGRVLFGTDLPFIDPRPQVGRVAFSTISEEDKLKVFGGNSAGIFGI